MRRLRVGYGKIGRSMPLALSQCGSLGGDVEMAATVGVLARRNPDVDFILIGRNTGESPKSVGLPDNVYNPWTDWTQMLLTAKRAAGLNKANLTIEEHFGVQDIYDDLTLPTITDLDHIILWAGQHGTTNAPLPSVRAGMSKLTKPHDWSAHYVAFLVRGVNAWRDVDPEHREEIWLNSDPRNYLKLRDLKWPLQHPVLAQHTYENNIKHDRYGDTQAVNKFWRDQGVTELLHEGKSHGLWRSVVKNTYARLEINGLMPGTPFGGLIAYNDEWENRESFGLFINETRKYIRADLQRLSVMRDWILPANPAFVHGTWSTDSLAELNMDIKPAPWNMYYPRLHSVRATFTTPASGTGWATAKPWEAFAAGTVCFFHPEYDKQNNVLKDAPEWLQTWLRVQTPAELRLRIQHLSSDAGKHDWVQIIQAQREHFDRAIEQAEFARAIERRIHG